MFEKVRHSTLCLLFGLTLMLAQTAPSVLAGEQDGAEKKAKAGSFDPAIAKAMNLSTYTTQVLTIKEDELGIVTTTVDVDNESWTLVLDRNTIRADDFQLLLQDATGALIPAEPPPVSTYRGTVNEIPGAVVSGGYWDGELRVVIYGPDKTIGIQPLSDAGAVGEPGEHMVYNAADSLGFPDGFCATDEDFLVDLKAPLDLPGATQRGTGLKICDLGIDTDFEYYQAKGSNSSTLVRDVELVINTVETIYEAADIGITYEITTIIVRTSSSDPYDSNDAGILLDEFADQWNSTPESFIRRDTAELMSGRSFAGSTLGISFLSTICVTSSSYSTVETLFSGSLTERAGLSAHELGHSWSATHCDSNPPCYIMCSVLGGCNGILTDFSNDEAAQISGFKNTRTCLSDQPDSQTIPFSDTFPTTILDTTKWTYNDGGIINTSASNEPSSPNSMNLDCDGSEDYRDDDLRTNFILLAGLSNLQLNYAVQHAGVEDGENLLVDYYASTREWLNLETIVSDGINQTSFVNHAVLIPALGYHNEFRVRFRTEVNSTGDDWYIDNVNLANEGDLDLTPPSPDPMTFLTPPTPASTTSIMMVATTATDDTPPIEYEFDFTGLNAGGTDSAWQSSTTYIDSGLIVNSDYVYRVRARDSVESPNTTAFSAEFTTATAIQTPSLAPLALGATNDAISLLTVEVFTNILLGSSGLYFDSTTPGGDGGLNQWIKETVTVATGLSPDMLYTFQFKARNQLAVETPFSPTVSKATLANVPGAPILGGTACDSMTIDVAANGNPSITTFAIQCTATSPNDAAWQGKFVDAAGNPSAAAVYQTDASWGIVTAMGLEESTSYSFQVTAKNQEGVVTSPSATSSRSTTACVEPAAIDVTAPMAGDVIQLDLPDPALIAWTASNISTPAWRIFLNEGAGLTLVEELFLAPVDDGGGLWHADWTVNSSLPVSDFYDIEVQDDSTGVEDHSGFFALVAPPPPPGCDGDVNGDGQVDPLDYGYVLARLGCAVGTGLPDCDAADVNLDGVVDPLDAGYVAARFGNPCL